MFFQFEFWQTKSVEIIGLALAGMLKKTPPSPAVDWKMSFWPNKLKYQKVQLKVSAKSLLSSDSTEVFDIGGIFQFDFYKLGCWKKHHPLRPLTGRCHIGPMK